SVVAVCFYCFFFFFFSSRRRHTRFDCDWSSDVCSSDLFACYSQESNARIKQIWERFLQYELGHLHYVMDLFKNVEKRDPAEILRSEERRVGKECRSRG